MNYAIKILEQELKVLGRYDNVLKKDPDWKYAKEVLSEKESLINAIKILKAEHHDL